MPTINQVKQEPESDSPLLLFQCVLPSGMAQYWSTHSITFNGQSYLARILKHNLFELQLSADDAMDGISQLSVTLANADSFLSELNASSPGGSSGFKGSQLTVYFVFADLPSGTVTTESTVLFRGVAGDPDEITENSFTLSFQNRLSLQRIPIPDIRIQRSCPWSFPSTVNQRTEARDGGAFGSYSRFYKCGYSADVPGGAGNLNNGAAFTSCDKSRSQCQQRGMFSTDAIGNHTSRYGGFEFVPSAIMVRTSGDKTSHVSPLIDNSAKYNDPVPMVYGTGWLKAPVTFARNDGNLTHMEALAGVGPVQGILKVIVNDVEIPVAVAGTDMTATGWYQLTTAGTRQGSFNLDFTDSNGNPLGDPYGSLAVLSIVVPNRISRGTSTPTVEVLMQGLQIATYNLDGSFLAQSWTNNPAWVILDILRRCGWSPSDMDLATFAGSAAFCQTSIPASDINGNAIQVQRYGCNLLLTKRQSAASVIRGIRVASSLMLRYGATGLLELVPETTLAAQQAALPDGSNSVESLNGGWPAYEFSDASAPFSGIARSPNGSSTFRVTSRTVAETSNRISVEFQDEWNEYQQDSLSIVDADDSVLIGYENSTQSTALGIANFSQATRVLLRQIDKSTKGNLFVEFQTSFRALKIRPGDIIAVTYLKEGFSRLPFRVVKLSPSMNYELVTIMAQIHDDEWYSDNPAVLAGAGRQPGTNLDTPRPLIGSLAHDDSRGSFEFFDFGVSELVQAQTDGSATDTITVNFAVPNRPSAAIAGIPLLDLAPSFQSTGGSLPGNQSFYYCVSAVDASGNEGPVSFTVPAKVPTGTNTNCVTLTGLSFQAPAAGFNVYRGTTPQLLYRIAQSVPIIAGPVSFNDTGLPNLAVGPPDQNFDHVNFYYRIEAAGPFTVSGASANTISNSDMGANPGVYNAMVARIIEGTGRGQERIITSNDATTLTVTPNWSTTPDNSSIFVVVEPSWKFAAVSSSSPVQFEIPFRANTTIQISGRGANVNNVEGTPDLCPLTRWTLGQSVPDGGLAPAPTFTLSVSGTPGSNVSGGTVLLSQIGFPAKTDLASVTSGTLQLHHWNELNAAGIVTLSSSINAAGAALTLTSAAPVSLSPGAILQVESELIQIGSAQSGNTYSVLRGVLGSAASDHAQGTAVLALSTSTFVVPFAQGFFENRASVNFMHTINLPDIRVAAAELFMTNAFGDGQTAQACYTGTADAGLRTLSGGQFSLQVSGPLATQQNAAPPLAVESAHAVRDVFATVNQAPVGCSAVIDLLVNGVDYGQLSIQPQNSISNVLSGVNLPALTQGANLSINVTLQINPNAASVSPGRDLTVTVRL